MSQRPACPSQVFLMRMNCLRKWCCMSIVSRSVRPHSHSRWTNRVICMMVNRLATFKDRKYDLVTTGVCDEWLWDRGLTYWDICYNGFTCCWGRNISSIIIRYHVTMCSIRYQVSFGRLDGKQNRNTSCTSSTSWASFIGTTLKKFIKTYILNLEW